MRKVTRRTLPAALAVGLLACRIGQAGALPPEPRPLSPEVVAQAAGAVAGFGIYSLFIQPQLNDATGIGVVAASRLMALTLAGAGAVAGTFIYDQWTGQPTNYAYVWERGGFIGGVAVGIAAFGVLGYPIDGGATWLGWAANRAALLGAGLAGSWAAHSWYQAARDPAATPAGAR